MATTFLGSITLAQAFPGFGAVLAQVRAALASLRAAAQVALDAVAAAESQINAALSLTVGVEASLSLALGAHIDALNAFRLSIRGLALADLQVQLQAALDIEASLAITISDPTAYIAELIAAVASVQIDLSKLIPSVTLAAQLDATLALKLSLLAKIEAFDLALEAIGKILDALATVINAVVAVINQLGAALQVVVAAMLSLSASLSVSIDASVAPLDAAIALEAQLAGGPLEMARYDGSRAGLGASVDAALAASSAIPAGQGVRAWLLVAADTAPAVQARLSTLLKTT